MTIAALKALHAVIGSAIDEIEGVYKSHSSTTGLPLDYPSLDVPYYSSRPNAPEVEKSEELRTEATVFGAANRIVAACGQITATVHKPFFSLVDCIIAVCVALVLHHFLGRLKLFKQGQSHWLHGVHGGDAYRRNPS